MPPTTSVAQYARALHGVGVDSRAAKYLVIHRYCAECMTAIIPELYRVCGAESDDIQLSAMGSTNQSACVEYNVSGGTSAPVGARQARETNADAPAARNTIPATISMGCATLLGNARESTSGSCEGPLLKAAMRSTYD